MNIRFLTRSLVLFLFLLTLTFSSLAQQPDEDTGGDLNRPCNVNADCPSYQPQCFTGYCRAPNPQPECSYDSQCNYDEICYEEDCKPVCTSNTNCNTALGYNCHHVPELTPPYGLCYLAPPEQSVEVDSYEEPLEELTPVPTSTPQPTPSPLPSRPPPPPPQPCSDPLFTIMKISDIRGGQSQLASYNDYMYSICVNSYRGSLTIPTDCSQSSSRILRLTEPTNAHAATQQDAPSAYPINICYDGITDCVAVSGNTCTGAAAGKQPLLKLSDLINAHVAGSGRSNPFGIGTYTLCCDFASYLTPCSTGSCTSDSQCCLGTVCNSGTCSPPGNLGSSCGRDSECASSCCNSGSCAPFETCEVEECTVNADCPSDNFCIDGFCESIPTECSSDPDDEDDDGVSDTCDLCPDTSPSDAQSRNVDDKGCAQGQNPEESPTCSSLGGTICNLDEQCNTNVWAQTTLQLNCCLPYGSQAPQCIGVQYIPALGRSITITRGTCNANEQGVGTRTVTLTDVTPAQIQSAGGISALVPECVSRSCTQTSTGGWEVPCNLITPANDKKVVPFYTLSGILLSIFIVLGFYFARRKTKI